jgi:hypothetical protein
MLNPKAVLIIGASGRTGVNLVQQFSKNQQTSESKPKLFAFCRSPSKLDSETKANCDGVIQGNARDPKDLKHALRVSKANLVVVSVGNSDNIKKTDIRTASAKALVRVLEQPEFHGVHVLVVSSTGAGGNRIIVGFGIGRMIEFHLRHILKDHDGQEAAFLASDDVKGRTMIVRPTALAENKPTGNVAFFGDLEKPPTIETDRKDLTEWLVKEAIYGSSGAFGMKPINITCVK